MADINNTAFDWDSIIEEDSSGSGEYLVLPEGNYRFTVTGFERGHHEGSAKIPPCPKATLTLEVAASEGTAKCTRNLYVCKHMERMLSDFFRCIGQKKRGEKMKMDWSKVVGSQGIAHFKPRKYNDREYNECVYFCDPDSEAGVEVKATDVPW